MVPQHFSYDNYHRTRHLQLKLIAHMTSEKTLTMYTSMKMPTVEDRCVYLKTMLFSANSRIVKSNDTQMKPSLNYQIRRHLSSLSSYINGPMLRRHNRHPKAWESLYCSIPEHKHIYKYLNGYDPEVPNIPREPFEVRTRSIGKHVGRGLFTKVDYLLTWSKANYPLADASNSNVACRWENVFPQIWHRHEL
jgi:hypothetical protein